MRQLQVRSQTLFILVSVGLVALLATRWPSQAMPTPTLSYQVYLPLAMKEYEYVPPFSILGLQIPYTEDPYHDQREAWRARGAGAQWLRAYIIWSQVEPVKTSPRTYDWSLHDAKFANMAEGGMNVIAVVWGNPSWAGETPAGPVNDIVDLTDFLAAAVERYDGDGIDDAPGHPRVEYWELYNEPDGFWFGNGEGYAQMLSEVYPIIKGANPEAKVVFGGVAHEEVDSSFDLGFVDDVMAYIQSNPGDYFDVMNFHYYIVFDVHYLSSGPDIFGKATYLREKLASYGIYKPMICTEAGYWSSCGHPDFKTGSHELQSRYVVQLYARTGAADLKTSIWFGMAECEDECCWPDPCQPACEWPEKRSLFDHDRNAKPAYNAYRTLTTRLGGATYQGSMFEYEPPSPGEPGWPLPPAEGYIFNRADSPHAIYILWTNDDTIKWVRIPASRVTVFDKFDPSIATVPEVPAEPPFTVRDGDDGILDGMVTISYGPSPIYVQVEE